jgi:hypothetical protein
MIPAEKSPNEAERIEALIKYALLDTLPEEALDDLTAMAAHLRHADGPDFAGRRKSAVVQIPGQF